MQRTAAISDHLIKTLTGFLVKSDLDDISYALMREVSSMGLGVGAATGTLKKGGVGMNLFGRDWSRGLGMRNR